MRGQISLELLITVGVVLAFTIPMLFLLLSFTSIGYEDTTKAQADAASRTLADAMNTVYSQGPGAKKEILLNVPASTQEVYASAGEAVVHIGTSGGPYEAASPTFAKISRDSQPLGKKSGLFVVVVRTNNVGEVELFDPTSP